MFFIGRRLTKPPAVVVLDKKVFPGGQKVLDAKPEYPYSVYEGYALYCINKDMYLHCIDSSTYDWIDTLRDAGDFLLRADGEPKPFGDFYRAISIFVGSLHCVLVPCKLYKKDYPKTKLFFKNMTYRGRYTEPNFNKSIDFRMYYERRIEEGGVSEEGTVSSNINKFPFVPNKKSGPPRPRPPAPPRPRIINH
jgi:hypothetical protein